MERRVAGRETTQGDASQSSEHEDRPGAWRQRPSHYFLGLNRVFFNLITKLT